MVKEGFTSNSGKEDKSDLIPDLRPTFLQGLWVIGGAEGILFSGHPHLDTTDQDYGSENASHCFMLNPATPASANVHLHD